MITARMTDTRILIAADSVSRIRGIGLAQDDENATHPMRWRGLNLLGFALARMRAMAE